MDTELYQIEKKKVESRRPSRLLTLHRFPKIQNTMDLPSAYVRNRSCALIKFYCLNLETSNECIDPLILRIEF